MPGKNSHLTKQQVHDAMLLINECLSDQQMRSGNLLSASPYNTCASGRSRSTSSPAKYQYSLPRAQSRSTSELSEEENDDDELSSNLDFSWCDEILHGVIAELTNTGLDYTRNESSPVDRASDDNLKVLTPPESLRTSTSCSDVDSGIDGSALVAQTTVESKLNSAKGENNTDDSFDVTFASGEAENKNINDEQRVKDEIEKTRKYLAQLEEQQV